MYWCFWSLHRPLLESQKSLHLWGVQFFVTIHSAPLLELGRDSCVYIDLFQPTRAPYWGSYKACIYVYIQSLLMRVAIYSDFHSIPGKPMSMACYSVHLTNISVQKASVHLTNIYIYIYCLVLQVGSLSTFIETSARLPNMSLVGGRVGVPDGLNKWPHTLAHLRNTSVVGIRAREGV